MHREPREARPGRRVAGWLALVLLTLALASGPAARADAAAPSLTLRPAGGPPGTTVTVDGAGFTSRTRVTLSWDDASNGLARPLAGRDGSFSVRLTVPADAAAGSHTLHAVAGGSQASATFQVNAPGGTPTATATRSVTATATTAPATATATATATAIPTSTAAPSSPTSVPPTSSPSGSFRDTLLARVNAARDAVGAPALALNASLNGAAQSYAEQMAASGCFAHDCPPEPSFSRRVELAGYTNWSTLAENIANGQRTVDDVHNAWMGSSGHRANILNPSFSEMGAGLAYNSLGRPYWVQEFGARR